jgi:hypothetical protein
MIYLSGASGAYLHPHLDSGELGILTTPNSNYRIAEGWTWAADNGCFNAATYVGDEAWLAWLTNLPHRAGCLFATAPDVVGDHQATLARSLPWLPVIRALGYAPAFVAQNGATEDTIPWDSFDWLFIGGDDQFKLYGSVPLIAAAQARGKCVHVGRVNSTRRYRRFAALGVDSADGTELAFGPVNKLPKVLSWRRQHLAEQPLWRTPA